LDEEESVVSKWEKLLKRIRRNPKAVRFNDVAKILESMSYEQRQPNRGSSHWTFRKHGCMPITIPRQEPYVKETYVKIIIDMLSEEEGV
jgi:hypothetical protein